MLGKPPTTKLYFHFTIIFLKRMLVPIYFCIWEEVNPFGGEYMVIKILEEWMGW
jgi:hypothetical protein